MRIVTTKTKGGEAFGLLYLANFIISFHLFLVVYVNSSFLSTFIEERFLGTLWIIGSIFSIGALLLIVQALRIFGNYKVLVAAIFLEMLLFVGFATFKSATLIIPLFVIYIFTYPLILYSLDIFLENFTKKENMTGSIRGTFLTTTNTALIIAPLLAGFILTNGDYWKLYMISATLLIPFLFIILKFRTFKDPTYHNLQIIQTFQCVRIDRNLRSIFAGQFLMRIFFSWMVIYMPIYLHGHIGFEWTEIGIMFAIMLLPFALLEYPAGYIADRWFGEKEILSLGFIIIALSTALIPFITTANFILWTALLFIMRVGASLIEIMTESYFFKHVSGDDNNTIGFFRMLRPFSYIVGPIIASITLLFLDLRFIFFVLAFILLYGLRYSLALRDTR